MFTGIISQVGRVTAISKDGSGARLTITLEAIRDGLRTGDSVAVNGACLTIESLAGSALTFTAVEETLARTNLGTLVKGAPVNVEFTLRIGDSLDGHWVTGHVDAVGELLAITPRDGSWLVEIGYPRAFAHWLVDKGSITVDGVSLTVIAAGLDRFTLTLIPYTWSHTIWQRRAIGDALNLEFDILAKYAERIAHVDRAC